MTYDIMPPEVVLRPTTPGSRPLKSSTSVSCNSDSVTSDGSKSTEQPRVKCVLIGDSQVGKTSMVVSYTTNGYPAEYVPTAFDTYSVEVSVDNTLYCLQLCDTAGQDDFDSLRPLSYPNTDIFLMCFSVVVPNSFYNTVHKWLPEMQRYSPDSPVILVGTQSDLRNDVKVLIELDKYGERPVEQDQIEQQLRHLGAIQYVECSSLTQKNLKQVFDNAMLAALDWNGFKKERQKKKSVTKSFSFSKRKKSQLVGEPELIDERPTDKDKNRGWKKFLCVS